jgi:hypothetical protein
MTLRDQVVTILSKDDVGNIEDRAVDLIVAYLQTDSMEIDELDVDGEREIKTIFAWHNVLRGLIDHSLI